MFTRIISTILVVLLTSILASSAPAAIPAVRIMRLPVGGVQPEIAVDATGIVHIVYFTGDARAGNLMYMKSTDGGTTFSTPIRVNSIDNSALSIGSVRGSQLALGRNGMVHVVWNASNAVTLRDPADKRKALTPLLYARLKDDAAGAGFEPEHNVIASHFGLDGGAAVAADQAGHVYVIWHAPESAVEGEAGRRVWLIKSDDDGATFDDEKAIDGQKRGCCACCGVTAFCAPSRNESGAGDLHVLYRTAEQAVHRDMNLLLSRDGGVTFLQRPIDQWEAGQCVMSTAGFAAAPTSAGETKPATVWATWETRGTVRLARMPASGDPVGAARELEIIKPAGQGDNAKHPVVTTNAGGEILLAWTENTSWNKGGAVAWQVFDREGKPLLAEPGAGPDLPVWGLVAAFATADGGFVIVY